MSNENRIQLITPLVRLSFPKLLKPEPYMEGGKPKGEPKFSTQMIIDVADEAKFKRATADDKFEDVSIKKICADLAKAEWPDMTLEQCFPRKPKGGTDWPIKIGNKMIEANDKLEGKAKKKLDYLKDKLQISVSASEKYPPGLFYTDPVSKERVQLDRDNPEHVKIIKKLFDQGGNYVICEVSVVAQTYSDKCYVTFYLNNVFFRKQGERMGGQSLMDRFDGIDGGEGEYDQSLPEGDNDFGV